MQIKTISYSALANTGNYENEKIELISTVEADEDWEQVLAALTEMVHEKLNNIETYRAHRDRCYEARKELELLQNKIEKARKTWETVSAFLIAQGIKSDPANFPDVPLLPQAEVVEPEIVDEEVGIF